MQNMRFFCCSVYVHYHELAPILAILSTIHTYIIQPDFLPIIHTLLWASFNQAILSTIHTLFNQIFYQLYIPYYELASTRLFWLPYIHHSTRFSTYYTYLIISWLQNGYSVYHTYIIQPDFLPIIHTLLWASFNQAILIIIYVHIICNICRTNSSPLNK